MKYKKALAGFLSLTIVSISGFTVFANNTGDLKAINDSGKIKEIMPIREKLNEGEESYFNSFSGVVKEIRDFEGVEGSKFVLVEGEQGSLANIVISKDTYIVDDAEIAVGSTITGFYKANAPMIMIYPAQYNAEVVAVENKDQNIKVDVFNKDLISADNLLKLNISDDTEIILEDGEPFEGDLENRKLVVTYDVSTKSIPAQTNPIKIVVLFEQPVHPSLELPEEETGTVIGDVSTMDIVVNDEKIDAPAAYTNEDGTVMVPLRGIAEALEFDVNWDNESQSIMLGKGISLKVGEDNYIYMRTAPIELGTAPELVEGTTFVPLSFFKEVVRMNNAYVFEGQIVIDNAEVME
ncbi:copper amine oxidase N-terminal domain-containing protein [Alkaliphilus sp. B6464]|uniref:copper amine oxidase N-terminal domain-containing protein n=1 Tax=Alkaliphilus sp. B6464 TaxID=2731219 RepID=UPI001BAB512A|nr:copper amine oxidase N-terminal domain-containing protein [Alkaliphilus sp. B6464]QUH21376.1 copper amine oxidase N-terminal domain-containing protein [Alkaliphilus sp. B6464]